MSPLLAASLFSLTVVQGTFILDDSDASRTIESVSMQDTPLEQCSNAGYNQYFHHDAGANKGNAHFKFTFEVPQDGCYSIEEYHPGHFGTSCGEVLTRHARLDLDWCQGEKSVIFVDQSKNGGEWNYLGIRPFYTSHGGAVKVSNPGGTEGTYLVADAFRFNRVGDKCTAQLHHQLWNEYKQRHAAHVAHGHGLPVAGNEVTTSTTAPLQRTSNDQSFQEGSLHLSIQTSPNTQDANLLDRLRAQTATLEATLQAHLQAVQVVVYDIQPISGRRLGGCRRLETSGSPFVVHFRAKGAAVAVSEAALADQLNAALGGSSDALQVESAELVDWYPAQPTAKERSDENNKSSESPLSLQLKLLIVGASLFVLAAVGLGSVLCIVFKQKARAKNGDSEMVSAHGVVKDVEQGGKVAPQEKLDTIADKADDLDDNASTATPTSTHTPESE